MRRRIWQGVLIGLLGFAAAPVFAQYVTGTRETPKPFFRGGETIDFSITLSNTGTENKTVQVVEAVPEGWTVLKVSGDGKVDKGGVVQSAIDQNFFTVFNPNPHEEDFNHVQEFWSNQVGGGYPYAGQSIVARGEDTNESGAPQPAGVFDLQLHPPNNNHLTVAAFVASVAGSYTISDLAVRRVDNEGNTVVFLVFDAGKKQIASLGASNDQAWITDTESYSLGNLKAGDRFYFAVGRDGDYGWDATEVAFTVKTGSTVWHSYDAETANGSPQATIPDESDKVKAVLEFYESEDNGGVNPNDPNGITIQGSIITWNVMVAPGTTTLTYQAKAPDAPKGSPTWFGTCGGYRIQGITTMGIVNKSALIQGARSASQPYYRAGDEMDLSITLTNPGTDAKTVTVVEAVPEGWTVISAETGAKIAFGGQIAPINQGLFTIFTPGLHIEGFNNIQEFWSNQKGGGYPYAGKSSVVRSKDTNETNAPQPLGVRDLQLHPPQNDHLTVAAFVVPLAGNYTVSDLATRRVYNQGTTITYLVFDSEKNTLVTLSASNDQAWVTDGGAYTLNNLKTGDRIYFAVSRDGDYGWDATEVAFTIKTGTTVWHSYDVLVTDGFPQATVVDETGKNEARIDFYESTNDGGVDQNIAVTTVKGSVITWTQAATPGTTVLTYKVKVAAVPTPTVFWIGTSDGIAISGLKSMSLLLPAVGIFDGHMDIGAVAVAGDAVYKANAKEYEVTGSGADIWGTADAFHFLFKEVKGDFNLKATILVDPFESTNDWVKAGLIVRDSLEPGSVYYDAILRTDLQATTQWRLTADGDSADTTTLLGADVQAGSLEIVRAGNTLSTYCIQASTGQRMLYNSRTVDLSDPVYVGLAVTSHQDGQLSNGIFTNVELNVSVQVNHWSLF